MRMSIQRFLEAEAVEDQGILEKKPSETDVMLGEIGPLEVLNILTSDNVKRSRDKTDVMSDRQQLVVGVRRIHNKLITST